MTKKYTAIISLNSITQKGLETITDIINKNHEDWALLKTVEEFRPRHKIHTNIKHQIHYVWENINTIQQEMHLKKSIDKTTMDKLNHTFGILTNIANELKIPLETKET